MLIKKTTEYLSIEQIVKFINDDFLRFWSIEIIFNNGSGDFFNVKTPLFNYDFYSEYYYNTVIKAKYIPYYPNGIPDVERKLLINKKVVSVIDNTVSKLNFDDFFFKEFKEKRFLLFYLEYAYKVS